MAINATNYDGTKDYKIAEVGDVYHPNLSINGDFQINQRGQTSYSNESLTPAYTLDMWYSIKATITKTDSGVTVSANKGQVAYFVQKIPCDNTKKTLVAKVNGKIYSTVFTGTKADIQLDSSVGSISTQYINSAYQQVGFIINNGKTANIEYADLFEGSIAYPHAKEDYSIAFDRCRKYIVAFFEEWVALFEALSTSQGRFVFYAAGMISVPTIEHSGLVAYQSGENYNDVISVSIDPGRLGNANTIMTTIKTSGGLSLSPNTGALFLSANGYLIATCEPL